MTENLPVAIDKTKVGTYPAVVHSGGGYFYDEVLEYRVWVCPPDGGDDYYEAFSTFEEALAWSAGEPRSDEPIVLVRQYEWVSEESPGCLLRRQGERLTEWQVDWLADRKARPGRIDDFLAQHLH